MLYAKSYAYVSPMRTYAYVHRCPAAHRRRNGGRTGDTVLKEKHASYSLVSMPHKLLHSMHFDVPVFTDITDEIKKRYVPQAAFVNYITKHTWL